MQSLDDDDDNLEMSTIGGLSGGRLRRSGTPLVPGSTEGTRNRLPASVGRSIASGSANSG